MINKYAVSLGCQVKAMQDLMFIPVPTQKKPMGISEFEVFKKERKNAGAVQHNLIWTDGFNPKLWTWSKYSTR